MLYEEDLQFAAVAIRLSEEKQVTEESICDLFGYGRQLAEIYLEKMVRLRILRKVESGFSVLKNKKACCKLFEINLDVVCGLSDLEKYFDGKNYNLENAFFARNLDIFGSKRALNANQILYAKNLTAYKIVAWKISQVQSLFASQIDVKLQVTCF